MMQHQLYAQMPEYKRRLRLARQRVSEAMDKGDAYVALSGGKDSTVVLTLARELQPNIPAVWSDDEWYLPETEQYMDRLRLAGVDLHQIRTTDTHAEWFSVNGDFDGIPDYARRKGWQVTLLGLRQDENNYRRTHLRTFGHLFLAKSDGFWHSNPIHDWTVHDVWAFITSNGIDYNRAYDRLTEMGIPLERQRIGPLAVERALGYGPLAILKRGWPELYNRFAAKYPEARSYV